MCPDVLATEYVNFDADIPAFEHNNEHKIDWQQKPPEDCINAVLNENNIAQEISDDDNDGDEEVDETLSFIESLKMLEKNNKYYFLDEESDKRLSTVTKKLEKFQLPNKKQKLITSYFSWFQSTKIPMLLIFDFYFEAVAFDLLSLK